MIRGDCVVARPSAELIVGGFAGCAEAGEPLELLANTTCELFSEGEVGEPLEETCGRGDVEGAVGEASAKSMPTALPGMLDEGAEDVANAIVRTEPVDASMEGCMDRIDVANVTAGCGRAAEPLEG
jgi:hypothetical protein